MFTNSINLSSICKAYGYVGHREQIVEFERAIATNKMHHAWLLQGVEDLGKAKFAFLAALRMLAGFEGNLKPTWDKFHSGAHLDFKYITISDGEKEIKVDTIRELKGFLSFKAIEGKYRIVIIDAVDDLNISAQNALLKTLEEPFDNTILFLVCNSVGKVLPTIRSRCRILKFNILNEQEFMAIARGAEAKFDSFELLDLYKISDGSAKVLKIISTKEDWDLYKKVMEFFEGDKSLLSYLAKEIIDENNWQIVKYATFNALYNKVVANDHDSLETSYSFEEVINKLAVIDQFYLDRVNAFRSIFA